MNYQIESEKFFTKLTGYNECVLSNSATSAFHSFLMSCSFTPGNEIIFPVECYPTLVMSAIQEGLIPIFCDVDEHYNLCPESLKERLTSKTACVVVIHMAGIPAKIDEIIAVIDKQGNSSIKIVEDWCQSLGTFVKGGIKKTKRTDAVILSFSSSKLLSINGGGLVLIDDLQYKKDINVIIENGYDRKKRFIRMGYSYFMHEFQAERLFEKTKGLYELIEKHYEASQITRNNLPSSFLPIVQSSDRILEHKIITHHETFDFFQLNIKEKVEAFFDIGEYHYPVDVYHEQFYTRFVRDKGLNLNTEADFPQFQRLKSKYFAFRANSSVDRLKEFSKLFEYVT